VNRFSLDYEREHRYLSEDEPMPAKPPTSVTRLHEQVQMLDEALTMLERNLTPVLRPESPEPTSMENRSDHTVMSPLHEEIESLSHRLSRAIRRVQSMDERIDV
jgi:hypothetical protein